MQGRQNSFEERRTRNSNSKLKLHAELGRSVVWWWWWWCAVIVPCLVVYFPSFCCSLFLQGFLFFFFYFLLPCVDPRRAPLAIAGWHFYRSSTAVCFVSLTALALALLWKLGRAHRAPTLGTRHVPHGLQNAAFVVCLFLFHGMFTNAALSLFFIGAVPNGLIRYALFRNVLCICPSVVRGTHNCVLLVFKHRSCRHGSKRD